MHLHDSGDHASATIDVVATAGELAARLQASLEVFRAQGFAVRSLTIVNIGPDRTLAARFVRLDGGATEPAGVSAAPIDLSMADAKALDAMAHLRRHAEEMCGVALGGDLLAGPPETLAAMMASSKTRASFPAVAAIMPRGRELRLEAMGRSLRRTLFDDGLVCIGSIEIERLNLMLFLASDAVRATKHLDSGGHGQIIMSSLGSNGRFANQLFQYAFMKLYALRHGAGMAVPDWEGRKLFRLEDPDSAGMELPQLAFPGFSDEELELWRTPNPPVNVDFRGYFQEIPPCWRGHRQLLRTLFELPTTDRNLLDAWHGNLTENGRRSLIAIHLRRTDYRLSNLPWFRIIPEEWYLVWLREIWPTLTDPVLFVASDEPHEILPHFAEFSPKSSVDLPGLPLPDHIWDFEILRRADHLAICNSSFSRMAAILAPETQRCFLPSISERRILPYEPWDESGFWWRFGDAAGEHPDIGSIPAEAARRRPMERSTSNLYLDITDLLFHLRSHASVSGIQRVQCELVRNLAGQAQYSEVQFTIFGETSLAVVAKSPLLEVLEHVRFNPAATSAMRDRVDALVTAAKPANVRVGDALLLAGAYWAVGDIGRSIQRLKSSGMRIAVFVHDILPISRPEFFHANAGAMLVRPVVEVLALADFLITSSNYNREALTGYRLARRLGSIPIHVVPLGHALPRPSDGRPELDAELAAFTGSEFVLCVGTIEVRKNPSYLLGIWKLMVDAGRDAIPTLVFAGRKGWLVEDFLEQLKACDYLDGKIVLLHDLPDEALDLLYRRCLLTMFPSFEEGWGLPVGESLSYGKICLASNTGAIPEVGGSFVDYLDPYNVRDGYARLIPYLDDPRLRARREEQIASQFSPRSWGDCADGIVSSLKEQMSPAAPAIAAVSLPANEFLPIGRRVAGTSRKALGGYLSADSACISGWGASAAEGMPGLGSTSLLRFRTDMPEGSQVTVILRLSASGLGPCHLRIRPISGAGQPVTLAPRSRSMATVSCVCGPGGLVTILFERTDVGRLFPTGLRSWKLKGFLYIQPGDLMPNPVIGMKEMPPLGRAEAKAAIKVAPSVRECQNVASLDAFLRTPDSIWRAATTATIRRGEPIFADGDDRRLFLSRYRNSGSARLGAVPDDMSFRRLRNPYVFMSRFCEGSIFDGSGVAKDIGFLKLDPTSRASDWRIYDRADTWIPIDMLAHAPNLDGTYVIFFNGNLHNYYHWIAEGLLALDVLSQTIGEGLDLKIILPKTMDIAAAFDHRASLKAFGFDRWPVIEAPPPIVRVGDAVWLESRDFIEGVPAAQVRNFQRRVASLYAKRRSSRGRRLLVKRLGPARAIDNFSEVEMFLFPLGFETVWLDGLTIEEQVRMFQSAEFIVGAHGAGLTNLLFCEPGTKVIEFMPRVEMRPFFWLISEKLGLRHAMQFCPAVDGGGFQASIHVDIDKLGRLYELIEKRR